jgi:Leucine-rich repeat (LRR) protein
MRVSLQSRSSSEQRSTREGPRACFLAVTLFLLSTPLIQAALPSAEHNALVDLYNSTNGASWTNKTNWLVAADECTWTGVTCAWGHVQRISLTTNNLSGNLPATLGSLTGLQYLWLSGNQLSGGIPPELGNLTSLQSLRLGVNQLSGSIPPELGRLASLQDFNLFTNQLSGNIPLWLGSLISLQSLDLSINQLSGSIPAQLGNLTSLHTLYLYSNQLSGSIPTELGNLTGLQQLNLSGNQLSGGIPTQFGNLTGLQILNLSGNQLSGSIPTQFGNLTGLQILTLYSNQLSGSIPMQLGNLSSLQSLRLNSNQLSGSIPSALTNLTSLVTAEIRWNALYSADPALTSFLTAKQGGDWQSSQTIAPTNLSTSNATPSAITVNWTPIAYTADNGFYQVWYSTTAGGPYTPFATTSSSKASSSLTVTGLAASTTYYFVVSATTQPFVANRNKVTSGFSAEVSGLTTAAVSPPAVAIASLPSGLLATAGAGATDRYTLINTGGAPTTVSLTQSGNFFTQSPASFTLQPGTTQVITLSSIAQPAGVYEGVSIPSGAGVPSGLTVPVRLLSAAPPAGAVSAAPKESRTDVSADVGTNPTGTVEFTNPGSATLQGILVSDSPWLVPQSGVITIPPGQTVTVSFTIDRSKRPDGGAVGSITGKLSLVFLAGTGPGALSGRVMPNDSTTKTGQVSVTIVDVAKPPVASGTIPPLGLNEVALLVGGLAHGNGVKGDLAIVNTGLPTSLNDLKLYYISSSSATQASSIGQLPPNISVGLADVVKSVFGRDGETGGVLLRSTSIDRVSVSAMRLNTSSPRGTYANALPVFRSDRGMAAGDTVFLAGLKKENGLHTNVCLQEAAGAAGSVKIDFLDAHGTTIGTRAPDALSPFGFLEIADAAPTGAVAARITSLGPSQSRIVAYGLAIDEATGDSWSLVDWNSFYGAPTTDPSVLPLAGGGTGARVQTDLALVNKAAAPNLVTLKYTTSAANRRRVVRTSGLSIGSPATPEALIEQTRTITLEALNSATITDVLSTMFAVPGDSIGYLTITPTANLAITGRTYAKSSQSGTSGTGVAAIPISSALIAGQAKHFAGIEDASPASVTASAPATYRTNLGLIETAGQTASVRVTMRYYFPAGQLTSGYAENAKDFTLAPGQFLLVTDAAAAIIGNARSSFGDLHNVQVEILVTGGNGQVLPFLQSIDNGTGDTILRTD